MTKKIYGWHFVSKTLRDGSPIPPDGEWLEYKGVCKMCESGLHFSDTPAMALEYAPGATLCYVEVENVIQRDKTKGVCSRRKIIARRDATETLRYFARMQEVNVIENYPIGTEEVFFDWLMGDDAAAYSARRATRAAAYSAARLTTCSAEAYQTAYSAASTMFNDLIYECFEDVMRINKMPYCVQCKWYSRSAEGYEGLADNDRCHHEKSGHRVGGIREEPRIVFYTCETMLKGFCDNHKLFEAKGGA